MRLWSYLSSQIDDNAFSSWWGSMFGASEKNKMATFTMAIIALSAKLAKADGRVTRDEVAVFKRLFTIEPEDEAKVGRLFNMARKDTAGFESYARQIGRQFAKEPEALRDLLTGLLMIAAADGEIDRAEHDFLAKVADCFGIPNSEFMSLASAHGDSHSFDPYAVLGLPRDAEQAAIRAAYVELVKRYHPDVWAHDCGMDQNCRQIAEERSALINRAYETLRQTVN